MNLPALARTVPLALCLTLSTAAAAAEVPPAGPSLEPHVHWSSGWKLTSGESPVELSKGGGVGLRVGYDFIPYVGVFASWELDVEAEGPYTGYGAGLTLHSPMLGPTRLSARLGVRLLNVVATIPYGTLGLGAEVFLSRKVSLGLEADAALPLADGTRHDGGPVSADGGPKRGLFTVTWYITG